MFGESIGLTDAATDTHERPIDNLRFPGVVREVLEVLLEIFHDSEKIKSKYGCRQATPGDLLPGDDEDGPLANLAASFSHFSMRSLNRLHPSKTVSKIVWIIHDRAKFELLVTEIKDLVDSLPSVSVARRVETMRRNIATIRDTETLSQIAEVCSEDHPDIADAASTKAETISLASTHRRYMMDWAENIEESATQTQGTIAADLESLTVTELKHKIAELQSMLSKVVEERNEREKAFIKASQVGTAIALLWLEMSFMRQ